MQTITNHKEQRGIPQTCANLCTKPWSINDTLCLFIQIFIQATTHPTLYTIVSLVNCLVYIEITTQLYETAQDIPLYQCHQFALVISFCMKTMKKKACLHFTFLQQRRALCRLISMGTFCCQELVFYSAHIWPKQVRPKRYLLSSFL